MPPDPGNLFKIASCSTNVHQLCEILNESVVAIYTIIQKSKRYVQVSRIPGIYMR